MIKTTKKLRCILLVDDDEITNSIHKLVIEDTGISKNIAIAESGDAALNLLECPKVKDCSEPDIIFLDLNMPGMNGWDFLDIYRKRKSKSKSLIIILSNSTNPYDQMKAEKYEEVAGFRSKPLTDLMMHEIINHYFES